MHSGCVHDQPSVKTLSAKFLMDFPGQTHSTPVPAFLIAAWPLTGDREHQEDYTWMFPDLPGSVLFTYPFIVINLRCE